MRAIIPLAVLGLSCLVSSVSAQGPTSASPVVADILKLSRAKVDEGVIVAYVQKAPRGNVSGADLLTLHSNGISSRVLLTLLDSPPTADRAQMAASTEVPPPVSEQAPAQPVAQSVAASASSISSPAVFEAPLVNYVSAPVYVGVGSIYYPDYGWWGIGWGWGYVGWSSWYPWYGYGCYPYYGYSGYYAHNYHHGYHNHGGHGHSVGHPQNGGSHSSSVGRSSIARSGGNPNSGLAASPASRSVSGAATARPQPSANRAGTSTASGNLSSRNTGNTSAGTSRAVASPGGSTVARSSTYAANTRATTAAIGQNGGARPGITPSGGANRPVAAPGSGQASSTMAGRSFAAPTRSAPSVYQGGGQRAPSSYAGADSGGGYSAARSYSAPSSVGNYSGGRSSGGSYMGGYSGGGGSRGFSGGGGGFGGGGGRSSGGGGGGGGGRR